MLASEIVKRARYLADMPNTTFITHDDETQSLNESYKDIYSRITEADDDYFYIEMTIPVLPSYAVAGTHEILVPLPANCYKIRRVDYYNGQQWYPMDRFAMSERTLNTASPMYRLQNGNLWIIGGDGYLTAQNVKVGYYPPPASAEVPAATAPLASGLASYQWATIQDAPFYYSFPQAVDGPHDVALFVLGAGSLYAQDVQAGTTTVIYSAAAVSNPIVHNGYVYLLNTTNIQRAPYSSTSITPAALATPIANATWIGTANNVLYYTNGANQTYSINDTGGSPSLVYAGNLASVAYVNGHIFAVTTGGVVLRDWVAFPTIPNCSRLAGYGDYLYTLSASYPYAISKYLISGTTATLTGILADTSSKLNNAGADYLGVIHKATTQPLFVSNSLDTEFDYPLNFLPELLSYQCAIDFMRKQRMDYTQLSERIAKKWDEFFEVLKRDEINVGRIQNHYTFNVPWWR